MHRLPSFRSLVWLAPALLLPLVVIAAGRPLRRRYSQANGQATVVQPMQLTYPTSKKVEQADDYHGTKIADPYRWLEDLDSDETRQWVEAQNKVTFAWLAHVPARESIRRRLTELWNYERYGLPHKKGGRYFYTRNDGLQNQNAVYVVDRLDGPPRLLLDPNTLSADGTIALTNRVASEDGKLLADGLAGAGSDWHER